MPSRSGSATCSRIRPRCSNRCPGTSPARRSSPGRSGRRRPGSGGGPRRARRRPAPGRLLARADVRPGMDDQVGDPQRLAALHLDGHGVDRFSQSASSGLARLIRYELWATGSTIPVSASAAERRDVRVGQRRGLPLVVVLGEELDGLRSRPGARPGPPGRSPPRSTCEPRTSRPSGESFLRRDRPVPGIFAS